MEFVARYRKFIVAAAAGLVVLAAAVADQHVSGDEWLQIIAAVLGPIGVGAIPNKPNSTL